ncbi:MAG: hypothetical protein HQM15_01495 [Deltaproteobacteria bacterium]|nr:hypothetical protein [Deltaproteobacteria bacterium]
MPDSICLHDVGNGVDSALLHQAWRANSGPFANPGTEQMLERDEYFRYLDSFTHLDPSQKDQAWNLFTSRLQPRENVFSTQWGHLAGYTLGSICHIGVLEGAPVQRVISGLGALGVLVGLAFYDHYSETKDLPMSWQDHAVSLATLSLGHAVTNILATCAIYSYFRITRVDSGFKLLPYYSPLLGQHEVVAPLGSFVAGAISGQLLTGLGLHRYLGNPLLRWMLH